MDLIPRVLRSGRQACIPLLRAASAYMWICNCCMCFDLLKGPGLPAPLPSGSGWLFHHSSPIPAAASHFPSGASHSLSGTSHSPSARLPYGTNGYWQRLPGRSSKPPPRLKSVIPEDYGTLQPVVAGKLGSSEPASP